MRFDLGTFTVLVSIFLVSFQNVNCWEDYEMDLFELVEEINMNLYDFLGVNQDATAKELKKAYRTLSLEWHPDKNDDPGAEVKFRNIVSVYEALKSEKTRKSYDQVLVEGLPNWRQGARYYFRKARKLSTLELSVFISIIVSIGHYFVLWASHFEKRLTLEDRMSEVKKKLDKKKSKRAYKGSELDDIDAQLQECYDTLPSPALKDTLPYRLVMLAINGATGLPAFVKEKLKKKEPVVESSESEEEFVDTKALKRNKEHLELNPKTITKSEIKLTQVVQRQETHEEESVKKVNKEWTDKEKSDLIKAVNRFPAGTANRWNKIADAMNRQPQDCIGMEKLIRNNFTTSSYLNNSTWSEKKTTVLNYKEEPAPSVKLDENFNETSSGDKWTQEQQAKLEKALKDFNKDTPNRWDRIAEQVSNKTKEDCMSRYKYICNELKKKAANA